jgi:uncharacterized membrane protein
MAILAIAFSFLLIEIDTLITIDPTDDLNRFYTFGPEGARTVLSVIASSMITVASLIFSITMLSLQLASSQYGPRVLDNFMRDRSNQIVLGTFIATFLYCLSVLRSVRGIEGSSFVPHLAVAFGVVLAVASVAVLIYFIHHIATSIRVETLLAKLVQDGFDTVDRLYPERLGEGPPKNPVETESARLPEDFEQYGEQITADTGGYVQNIGVDALMAIATEHDLIVRIEAPPGRFVAEGEGVVHAYPNHRISDEIIDDLRGTVVIGQGRTPHQDLDFAVRRIVELAQRTLSSGINDPTTALYCIDRLGEIFRRLASRSIPAPRRFDQGGQLRVLTEATELEEMTCKAFAAIARYGISDTDVVDRLAATLAKIQETYPPAARDAVIQFRKQVLSEGR